MTIDVIENININRVRKDVAKYAMNPDNDPIWIGGISEAKLVTKPPIGKGAVVERVAHFLGKRIDYTLEVTEYEPDKLMVMQSIKSPFPMTVTYQFEDTNDGSMAQIRIQGGSDGFYKLAGPLMARQVRQNLKGDLKALKKLIESAENS